MSRQQDSARPRAPTSERRRRAARRQRLGRWLALALLVGVSLAYVHPIRSYQDARNEIVLKQAEVTELERKRDRLQKRLKLAEEEMFVVREARTHGLVRPGETLFLVQGIEKWLRAEERRVEERRSGG